MVIYMTISIHQNKSNIKNTEEFFNNYYLNELIDFFIKTKNRTYISTFIRSMFYVDTDDDYYETYLDYSSVFNFESENFLFIYNLFNEWKPIRTAPIGTWRGIFLELLSFK